MYCIILYRGALHCIGVFRRRTEEEEDEEEEEEKEEENGRGIGAWWRFG